MSVKKTKLKDIFRTKLYKALVLPMALLIFLFSVVYIFQINSTINQQQKFIKEQFYSFFQDHVDNQSQYIEKELKAIEYSLMGIDKAIENYYKSNKDVSNYKSFDFYKDTKGFLYKPDDLNGSSVVFMPQAKPTESDKIDAYNLEKIDPIIMPMVDNNDIVIAAWMNLENYLVRYYPYFDMKNILMPDMDLKSFNFYYEADHKHNPYKKNIWTTPYLDPAMKGWMISRVAPIYNEDKLIGVFGYDISVDNLVKNIKLTLPTSQNICVFITNEKGDILSIDKKFKNYIGLKPLKNYYHGNSLSHEVLLPNLYNIFTTSNSNIKDKLKVIYEHDNYIKIDTHGKRKYIFKSKIENLKWNIFYVVDEQKLIDGLASVQYYYNKVALIILLIFLSFFVLIMINLKRRLNKTIVDIIKPIEELSEATKNLQVIKTLPKQKIFEISVLYDSFINMAKRIFLHKEDLEKKVDEATLELTKKIETIEKLKEKLIDQNNHDYLTKLFTRRYGDIALSRELNKAIQNNQKLTVVMLDIDNFKLVNDSLGHQVGDTVLATLGSIIISNMEDRSIPIRYGGEEFLLIFPHFSKDEAKKIVEVIREQYNNEIKKTINIKHGLTISAGISSYPEDAISYEKLVRLADDALYKAKNSGKDKVVVS